MANSLDLRFSPLTLRSVTGVTLANPALFYAIGVPLEAECRIIKFDNLTNVDVFISRNGVTAFTIIPTGGFLLLDITANKSNLQGLFIEKGAQFWANAAVAPTSGSVYVSAFTSAGALDG